MEVLKILQILFCVVYFTKTDAENAPSVIIVGAGAAGIAAASKLLQNNISNLIILEAENRIGGRIHSVEFGDSMIDLGAHWCQGQFNIVYNLMKDDTLPVLDELIFIYRYSSGEPLDQTFPTELTNIFWDIYINANCTDAEGLSMGDYVFRKYNEVVHERYGQNEEQLEFAIEFNQTIHQHITTALGAFSSLKPSATRDYQSAGDKLLNWNGQGYKIFLNFLMKIYPNPEEQLPVLEKTRFNKKVTKINWKEDVSVECSDNSKFAADHVIVTPSLGVLKHSQWSLFHPRLPKDKVNAIQELGFEAVLKVYLHFPLKWWSGPIVNTYFLWSKQDRLELLKTISDDDELGSSWILDIYVMLAMEKNPNVLEVWFTGQNIAKMELFSDYRIIEGIMHIFEKFMRVEFPNLTKPDKITRENWYSNPNFRGTYSFQTVESRRREISGAVALSQPLFTAHGKKSVLFAGEATHPKYYSTVHGAVETGFREAERIINFYK